MKHIEGEKNNYHTLGAWRYNGRALLQNNSLITEQLSDVEK